MPLGVEVNTRVAPVSRGVPTSTDTLFLAGTWSAGPTTAPVLVRSMADVDANVATRTSNTALWDYLDVFFREGGKRAYVIRYTTGVGALATALNLFGPELGPGQVVAPSETPGATTYGALLDHAAAMNRFALLDVGNGDTVTAMTTLATAVPTSNVDYGAVFGPWVTVPPPAGVVGGTDRTVHGSAVVAALVARADALGNPNRAAAGRDFPLRYVTGFARTVTWAERDALLSAGVNLFADRYGALQLYGFQTKVAQTDTSPYWQANAARARMWLKARALAAGENYMFRPIDGRGLLANGLKTDLDVIAGELYAVNGLYGVTPDEAFQTTVGIQLNTTSTVAQGELNAQIEARFSLHTKRVLIDLVTVPVTGRVAA